MASSSVNADLGLVAVAVILLPGGAAAGGRDHRAAARPRHLDSPDDDREPDPDLYAPGRLGRDPPGRHEPGAQDTSADRGPRHGRRAECAYRRGPDGRGSVGAVRRVAAAD